MVIVLDADTGIQIWLVPRDELVVCTVWIHCFVRCQFGVCKFGHRAGNVGFQRDIGVAAVPLVGKNYPLGCLVTGPDDGI